MNKLRTLSRIGFFLLAMQGFLSLNAQVSEPSIFDWKESYVMTTKEQVFYDHDIISSVPSDAMFWVDIQPMEKKLSKSMYALDGEMIYEHSKVLEHKVNGKDYKHGFVEMVHANGRSYFKNPFNSNNFVESKNNPNHPTVKPSGSLFSPGLSFETVEQNLQTAGWMPIYFDGKIWYRNVEAGVEINIDASNGIINSKDLDSGAMSYDKYEEVEPNIWRNTINVEVIPTQTIEGYCIEKRTTTTIGNFSFDVNNGGLDASISKESLSEVDLVAVKQEAGDILIERLISQANFDLMIYDVMGRLVHSEQKIADNRIHFQAPVSGIYFVVFIQEGRSEVTKTYLH